MHLSLIFLILLLPLSAQINPDDNRNPRKNNETDGRNRKIEKKAPKKDPELANYYINLKTSPRPELVEPVQTTLPLKLEAGNRIALIGNLLLDAERRNGHLETLIHQQHPQHELTVRNLAWPADEIDLMPRPDNFGDLDQHLHFFKADVIIAAYGFNESFAGKGALREFRERFQKFATHLKTHAYNGRSAPKVVFLSPVANEEVPHADVVQTNSNLRAYTATMKEVCAAEKVGFVDVFSFVVPKHSTIDGHALNQAGHAHFAQVAFQELFQRDATVINEELRELVVDKASQFFYRYRPLNTFYYTGARNKSYGYLDFLPAMRNFDLMVGNRDRAIHQTAASGKKVLPDDSNLPELDEVLLSRGANKFLSPAEEQAAFKVDPRFEVNCFASEEDFPEMACPIAMRWDPQGRLWVSTSATYPHVYPGQKPSDKIIILEDTDQDGKADKCTTWADDLHVPLSFVLDGKGGVYCSEQPHLTHLTDRDGDGKMDHREILFTGFGCEDSHHSLHDFTWTPGGDLLFRESIFHHSQVETVYGPIRARNSSWFLYTPSKKKLMAFGAYPNTNPWGVAFDQWGNHVASHPIFASTFHAANPPYPREFTAGNGYKQEKGQHAPATGMQAYSGTCGHDFVCHDIWPAEMQGGFIKARYKPTNKIEFHTWNEEEDHFAEKFQFDLIFSSNLSFIPVDLNFGPRGELFICDWYNPVKGHAQYSLRDPRRDRKAGRIWRVIPKGAELPAAPKIAGASVEELLDHLKSTHIRTRYRTKIRLRSLDPQVVSSQLKAWIEKQDDEHALLEALWLQQSLRHIDPDLLGKLLHSKDHRIAAAAFGPLRFLKASSPVLKKYLAHGVTHPSQHVRREAVLCASYLLSSESNPAEKNDQFVLPAKQRQTVFEALLPILDQPAGVHLSYAITSAFHSAALKPHWYPDTAEKLKKFGPPQKKKRDPRSNAEKKFDRQKNLVTVKIGTIPARLLYTKNKFTVTAGQPVKLVFSNPDATEHNLLILAKNTPIQEIGEAANAMARDPEAAKKHYIPDDERIIHTSRMLKKGQSQTLRFKAPSEPGTYPYVCTFPGHWTIMNGTMTVRAKK